MPGVTVADVTSPQFDWSDPIKWFGQLTEYAGN